MTDYTWDIPTRNARALRYLAAKKEQAEKRHIRLIRNRKRITGVIVSRLGLIALMALISIGSYVLVYFLTVIFRG
jgi:hypothetical protein|tara:strand:- start:45 stop:269 length:225 start_codon:yes stop_codon:yes gene_type:complete